MTETRATTEWVSVTALPPDKREDTGKRAALGLIKCRAGQRVREIPAARTEIEPPDPRPEDWDPVREIIKQGVITASQQQFEVVVQENWDIPRNFWRDHHWDHPLHPFWSTGSFEQRLRDGWDGTELLLDIALLIDTGSTLPAKGPEALQPKKRRGRPIGTGLAQSDAPLVAQINSLVRSGVANSPTAAAKMLTDPATTDATIRRLVRRAAAEKNGE